MLISKYLKQIRPYFKNEKYIFRGVSASHYLLETSALRRLPKDGFVTGGIYKSEDELNNIINASKYNNKSFILRTSYKGVQIQLTESFIEEFNQYNIDLINQAEKQGYGEKNLKELSHLQILAELQHFGAATCLLDFSKNFLTALWFAIDGNREADGKIYMLKESNYINIDNKIEKEPITYFLNNEQIFCWVPQNINSRIIAQDSIFVLGRPIISDRENIQEIIISKEDKPVLRYELKKYFNIDNSTLFPDFQGFALANSPNNSVDDSQYDSLSIINYLIKEKEWDEVQSNITKPPIKQLGRILRTLLINKVKINSFVLKHIEGIALKTDTIKDIIDIINYTTEQNFNDSRDTMEYHDYIKPAFHHQDLLKIDPPKSWFDVKAENFSYNKRDYIFGLISTYIKNEYWEDQKEFEQELFSNPNINEALRKDYKYFLTFINDLNEN